MKNALSRFNVRVYGLLINEHNQVLVADEVFKNGNRATKFPGGGLELGEGTKEGLIREFKEETGIDVTVQEHFYTTDFFQASYFDNDSQIISIYYKAESKDWKQISVSNQKFDFTAIPGQEAESFRWVYVRELENEEDITLPIDKVVVAKLLNEKR
ncbi:MAG: NUDIX hydrolase [Chitinophagales bacterium]|jgi:8-oxo-dGTP diphosphatase|nr:NUDIX hydrolase [Chitinophagales bacterium]